MFPKGGSLMSVGGLLAGDHFSDFVGLNCEVLVRDSSKKLK